MRYSDAAKGISAALLETVQKQMSGPEQRLGLEAIRTISLIAIASAQLMQVGLNLEQSLSGVLGTQPEIREEAPKAGN